MRFIHKGSGRVATDSEVEAEILRVTKWPPFSGQLLHVDIVKSMLNVICDKRNTKKLTHVSDADVHGLVERKLVLGTMEKMRRLSRIVMNSFDFEK